MHMRKECSRLAKSVKANLARIQNVAMKCKKAKCSWTKQKVDVVAKLYEVFFLRKANVRCE